jgi:hypothetical protein
MQKSPCVGLFDRDLGILCTIQIARKTFGPTSHAAVTWTDTKSAIVETRKKIAAETKEHFPHRYALSNVG